MDNSNNEVGLALGQSAKEAWWIPVNDLADLLPSAVDAFEGVDGHGLVVAGRDSIDAGHFIADEGSAVPVRDRVRRVCNRYVQDQL